MLVDDDPVLHLQASLLCKLEVRADSNSGYDSIHSENAPAFGLDCVAIPDLFEARHRITWYNLYALLAIIVIQEMG